MADNILDPREIKKLKDLTFYVDSYQRGYRWTKTEINALLNDLNLFLQQDLKDAKYWLQPVIVKAVKKKNKGKVIDCYELIDGQQRLTTIYLIYYFLKGQKPYNIIYNTRTSSEEFLEKIEQFRQTTWEESFENSEYDKIDNFHFFNAFKLIQKWFEENDSVSSEDFYTTLTLSTNIIWYELVSLDDNLPRIVFENINIGKIPLTNAELVKAFFLNDPHNQIQKNEIAEKWDRIEFALNDNQFWSFICNNISQQHNRIEYLLDLISGKHSNSKNKEEKLHTFLYFLSDNNKETLWDKIEEYFQTLLSWYDSSELYHYVGFLLTTELYTIDKLMQLYQQNKDESKSEFNAKVKFLIHEKLNGYNYELTYDKSSDYKKIVHILLLFNIQTILNTAPFNYFPFFKFKSKHWSLEHIHAQRSKSLTDSAAIENWITETKPIIESYLSDSNKGKEAAEILLEMEQVLLQGENKKLGELPSVVFNFFGDSAERVHEISNMALLDIDTNSALNNSVFPLKRKKILDAELSNIYIPICTKNVFLKYYSKDITHMQFWSDQDKNDYLESIKKSLEFFIPEEQLS